MMADVPAVNTRAHIESVLRAYTATWASGDVAGRLALFGDDAFFEDPASVLRASGRAEIVAAFAALPPTWDLSFEFVRVAVVGDEALATYVLTLQAGDASTSELLVNSHVVFGPDGLIRSIRTFFDAESITDL
jgi:ketosteroid isomerase-like protein